MFKKVLALTLALVMLLMPMTASAVTWKEIVDSGYSYSGLNVQVSKDEEGTVVVDAIDPEKSAVVTFGYRWDSETDETTYLGYIDESGNYVFKNVMLFSAGIQANDKDDIHVTFDDSTKMSHLYIIAHNDSSVSVTNNTDISYGIYTYILPDGSKVKVTGNGTISGFEYGDNAESPLLIEIDADGSGQEAINKAYQYAKENVKIDLSQIVLNSTEKYGVYEIWYINSDGEWEYIEIEILPEEEEPEPDPIELQRQAEGIGGVTTSPVWNWQGYLGHSSKPMWIYVNGEKVLMRQRLFWLGDSTKNHTCRINLDEPDPASVELRIGLDMLRTAQRAEISVISILDKDSNPIAQFAVSDLLGAFEQYGLEEGELLCVSADPDAEVMKVTLDGEYLPLEEAEEENVAA